MIHRRFALGALAPLASLLASQLAFAEGTLEEKLAAGQYIHSATFAGATGFPSWNRDSTEFEGVIGLTCKDPGADQTAVSKQLM
jgi:hypothetical protein